jgi:hypothetical protein
MLHGRGGVVFGFLDPVVDRPQGFLHGPVAFSQSAPLKPMALMEMSPWGDTMMSMVRLLFIRLHPHEHEFDGTVWLMPAKNG